jgi:hypothetical protein
MQVCPSHEHPARQSIRRSAAMSCGGEISFHHSRQGSTLPAGSESRTTMPLTGDVSSASALEDPRSMEGRAVDDPR